ncbi:MAG TPA: hypothetical protein VFD30_18850 [Terriglobia bacterium]|nr:hypothetical protein [Terriglobia bacterium]
MHSSRLARRLWTGTLAFILSTCPLLGGGSIRIKEGGAGPLVDFGTAELRAALNLISEAPEITLTLIQGKPESFSIRRVGNFITIEGGDFQGLMYGALEVAEKLTIARDLSAIHDETQSPRLPVRALKFNIPLAGTMYLSEEDLQHNQWFWDLNYWQAFLDMAARNRYNCISFWSAHPYDRMVRIAKYPEATSLPPAELDKNIQFFQKLFRMARERGLDPYLITWNIHNSPSFAKAHQIAEGDVDSELVRDYQRECIKSLLATYPDLIGLGTTQGERMDVIPEKQRPAWISDVYFRAIRESGRRYVPFVLRYWGGSPTATEQAAAAYDLGPVYLDIKYNGEHMYSSTRYHVEDPAWIRQPHHYKLLWHLRNDDLYILRWGNPAWVSELLRNLAKTDTVGFTEGSEIDVPGIDRIHTAEARSHLNWKYKFEKMWFRFALWGRLGYNPDLPQDLWKSYFRLHFGAAGEAMYRATVAAGTIAPTITSYHWNYMNGDWYPEGSIGSWNTAYEQPRMNYRRNEMFHRIDTYIFNTTIDPSLEDPLSYVARTLAGGDAPPGAESPLDVAKKLEEAGRTALAIREIPIPGGSASKEFICARLDNEAYGHLGLYYAEKLRGAIALARFLFSGDGAHREQAVEHLHKALDEWKALAAATKSHYITHEVWLFGQFNWEMYTPDVERDIEIARHARPFEPMMQTWQVARGEGSPKWNDFESIVYSPFDRAGLHEWLVYFNTQYNAARLRKLLPEEGTAVRWKARIAIPPEADGVLEIGGDPAAKVTLAGRAVAGSRLEVQRSYQAFGLGKGGEVEVVTNSGAVPFLGRVTVGGKPILQASAGSAQRIHAPLQASAAGTIIVSPSYAPPANKIGASEELSDVGAALYNFHAAQPGFYRVLCLVRTTTAGRSQFIYTVDDWNGHGRGMMPRACKVWQWVSASHALALGAGEHTLRLQFDRPGIEIKEVRVAVEPLRRGGAQAELERQKKTE